MSNPLDDPRAPDLLSARPDDVSALAANFHLAAGESETTAAGLSAAREDGTWTGRAAEAFRRAIGRLPAQLARVRAGYAAVAQALYVYEPELARVQAEFVQVVDQLSGAQSRVGPAQAAAQSARQSLTTTAHAKHAQRPTLTSAELAVARADGALDGYRHEIAGLSGRAFALLDEFSAARSTCRDAIAAAQRTAPVRPRPRGAALVTTSGGLTGVAATPVGSSSGGAAVFTGSSEQAQQRIAAMIRRADALLGTPYVYGGGHAGWENNGGLDCSGFVSAILRSGGYLTSPVTTEGFSAEPDLSGGPGRLVTIYDRTGCGPNEHVIIDLDGRFYESGGGSASGGAPFVHQFRPSASYLGSFNTILHPVGL